MERLKMQTPDLTDKNIERIASLFPNVITETKDDNGNVKRIVDFDLLKQALSKNIVEGDDERYRLDWPGKKASLLKANTPITKTLRPCREESVNFDTTENLYIEGDNFEVLKILQESYLGKVKMIYIDPPYNTGNDFIYKDDFAKSREDYEEELGTTDEEGGKLFRNTDSNGRFHSDWLSMMYERLVVARDLLKDDGVIFISIDDGEVHNLRKICDEVFGEENLVNQVIWQRNSSGKTVTKQLTVNIEYLLIFSKSSAFKFNTVYKPLAEATIKMYSKDDNDGRGKYRLYPMQKTGSPGPETTYDYIDNNGKTWKCPEKGWRMIQSKIKLLENDNRLCLDNNTISEKAYWNERENEGKFADTLWNDMPENSVGSKDFGSLFDKRVLFSNPKPIDYLVRLLRMQSNSRNSDIVIDFFSGSATSAHAVMQLNAEDGGNRKFIMIQLPEKTDESSEAYKAGYKTIAEIGKERIRRAGKKIIEELKAKNQQLQLGEKSVDAGKLDIGFRVYKTDESNMKDVFYHPAELKQDLMSNLESNIKEDRTPEDLLTQVILDLGLELSLPIETKKMLKNTVFIVQTNALVTCFDKDIDFTIVDSIAVLKPFKVVFKDASFKDDKDRINVEERFKRLSPETRVTVI
jgi:adenine-specific DNA-methyltransferase